jgi:ribosomal protein L11 methyltransferase
MLELFPDGFEEREESRSIELAAYTDAGGEERLWQVFGSGRSVEVADDWHERWRQFHRAVRVGQLWIGPPWEQAPPGVIAVVIEPGQAFGTGGHATTRLCLALLERLAPSSLVDVGCGSGVLSIAAGKLGFAPLIALDSDPQAVAATTANASRNAIELDVRLVDVTQDELPESESAVANITLAAVERLAGCVHARHLVTSGYLSSEHPSVAGYRPLERLETEGWAADLLVRDE